MAVSSQDIQNWFAANPGATPEQVASTAAQYGVTASQIDQTLGSGTAAQDYIAQNYPTMQQTYGTDFGVSAPTPVAPVDPYAPQVQNWQDDFSGFLAQGPSSSINWNDPTMVSQLDDVYQSMLQHGMSPEQLAQASKAYGVAPDVLAAMSRTPDLVNPDYAGYDTGDKWVQGLLGTNEYAALMPDYAGDWLRSPYSSVSGEGDVYAGLSARGYSDPFTQSVMPPTTGGLTSASLQRLTGSPYFNVAGGGFDVAAGDRNNLYSRLRAELGTSDYDTLNQAAQYLYGETLQKPATARPPTPASTGGSSFTGTPTSNVNLPGATPPVWGLDTSSPFSGLNWRETILGSMGQSPEQLYNTLSDLSQSGDYTLSSIQREMGLNPGEAMALYEEAVRYARNNGLPIPLLPATTRADKPYVNYGYGPAQNLFTRGVDNQTVTNPIAAYLQQIQSQRQAQSEVPVTAATGGYLKDGGLAAIERDPVIKKYLKHGGGGGQDDDIPAMLSNNEYVMDADVVSALGDGNPDAGARKLDKMRENVRRHKRSASPKSIPPKAKEPEQYLKG